MKKGRIRFKQDDEKDLRKKKLMKIIKKGSIYNQCFLPKRVLGKLLGVHRYTIHKYLFELEVEGKIKCQREKITILK